MKTLPKERKHSKGEAHVELPKNSYTNLARTRNKKGLPNDTKYGTPYKNVGNRNRGEEVPA